MLLVAPAQLFKFQLNFAATRTVRRRGARRETERVSHGSTNDASCLSEAGVGILLPRLLLHCMLLQYHVLLHCDCAADCGSERRCVVSSSSQVMTMVHVYEY